MHFRIWLPSALLIVVAMIQFYLMHVHHLDPWVGGGFAMFAHVDHQRFRSLEIMCTNLDGTHYDCKKKCEAEERNHRTALLSDDKLRRIAKTCFEKIADSNIATIKVSATTLKLSQPDLKLVRTIIASVEVKR